MTTDPVQALLAEILRLRPNYQSQTGSDMGRRQMLDHFELLLTASIEDVPAGAPVALDQVPDASRSIVEGYARDTPLRDLSLVLFEAWVRTDPGSGPAQFPASYLATFVDMARAVLAWNEQQAVAR